MNRPLLPGAGVVAPTPLSYKPSAYYFRRALEETTTLAECREIGRQIVRELEHLKEWARDLGLVPPRRFILSTESDAKGFVVAELSPSPASDAPAPVLVLDPQDAPASTEHAT